MKKGLKVTLIAIAVIILVIVVVLIDITRIIEKPSDEVVKIAKETGNAGVCAYSVDKTDDKLVVTLYGSEYIIKYVWTYYITDGIITSINIEGHYEAKITAIIAYIQDVTWANKKLRGNVITGIPKSSEAEIGKSVDELLLAYTNGLFTVFKEIK